jgi:hypothetical protein
MRRVVALPVAHAVHRECATTQLLAAIAQHHIANSNEIGPMRAKHRSPLAEYPVYATPQAERVTVAQRLGQQGLW